MTFALSHGNVALYEAGAVGGNAGGAGDVALVQGGGFCVDSGAPSGTLWEILRP